MSRYQTLYKENGLQSSKRVRLQRERGAIRAKERNAELQSRRNILVSPVGSGRETNLLTETEEANKENAGVPIKFDRVLQVDIFAGKDKTAEFTRREQFLRRFVEWKETKKRQEALKKAERETQKKPFLPFGSTAIKETSNSKAKTLKSLEPENSKKRQSLYTIVATPPRKKDRGKGAVSKTLPIASNKIAPFPFSIPRPVTEKKIEKRDDLAKSRPVIERFVASELIDSSKQITRAVIAQKTKVEILNSAQSSGAGVVPVNTAKAEITSAKTQNAHIKTNGNLASDKAIPTKAVVTTSNSATKGHVNKQLKQALLTQSTNLRAAQDNSSGVVSVHLTAAKVAPTKKQIDHVKANQILTSDNAIPTEAAVAPFNSITKEHINTQCSIVIGSKTRARIVKPIISGGGGAQTKKTFEHPLPPPLRAPMRCKQTLTKQFNSEDGASGKAKKHAAAKCKEGLKNNRNLSVHMKAKKPSRMSTSSNKTLKKICSELKLNKNNLLEVQNQGLPVAETPTDLTNINPFGFFVTSTKRKSSASNFNFVNSSEPLSNEELLKFVDEDEYKKGIGEASRQPGTPEAVKENLKIVRQFKKQLADEIDRLHALCERWEQYKDENMALFEGKMDGVDMIDVTIGQTKLLTSKKFIQFSGLIDRCEKCINATNVVSDGSEDTKPITPTDLEGFWSMLCLQVDNIDKRFESLERWRSNDWLDPDAAETVIKTKTQNNAIKKAKKILRPAKPSIGLEQMMRKMHAAMRSKKTNAFSATTGDADIILIPTSQNRKSKSSTPQHNSTPRRNSLIVKDKKFYSVAPTVLIKCQSTPERRNSINLNLSKDSPKQLIKNVNSLTNSLKKLEKTMTRDELLKSALKGAKKQRFTDDPNQTPSLRTEPLKTETTTQSLNTPLAIKPRKSILKTPGTATGNNKNVIFNKQLSIRKFKFTIDSDQSADEEVE